MDKEPEVFDVKDMNGASPLQKGLAVFFDDHVAFVHRVAHRPGSRRNTCSWLAR
jgi:hypothetical protein